MAALDFPNSPSNGDTYSANGLTYTYNSSSTKWVRTSPSVGAQGATGSVTVSNNANNRIITATGGATANAESNLTFDGTTFDIGGSKMNLPTGTSNPSSPVSGSSSIPNGVMSFGNGVKVESGLSSCFLLFILKIPKQVITIKKISR